MGMLVLVLALLLCAKQNASQVGRYVCTSISKIPIVYEGKLEKQYPPIPEPISSDQSTTQDPISLYNSYIDDICAHYDNLDPDLVRSVVWVESRFDPDAVNYNGTCIGLMQISTKWHTARAERLGVDLHDPYGNLLTGCDLLSELISAYDGDVSYALMVYNMGYSGANKLHSQGKVSSYVLAVESRQQELKGAYT